VDRYLQTDGFYVSKAKRVALIFILILYGGKVQIKKSSDIDLVRGLHQKIFPLDEPDLLETDQFWIVYSDRDKPVGFCSVRPLEYKTAYFNWAGLLEEAQGKGLHRRMIYTREKWCRRIGFKYIVTYTVIDNIQSSRNLLKCNYDLYLPEHYWAEKNSLYFQKKL